MKLLFCNVGWMERYQGLSSGDLISGGGAYVREHGRGHEICNFVPVNGIVYGYVQPPGQQIDIDRIGAKPHEDFISGVTVIWTATRPTGGTAVVGWYKNATIFRTYQKFQPGHDSHDQNGVDGHWIRANESEAKLLTIDERTCEIPRQVKGGMGQSNIWYADSPESAAVVTRVKRLLAGTRVYAPNPRPRAQDQELKAKVEKIAIRTCCDHFDRLGYIVKSVEKDNLGWDLVAVSGRTSLRIEVKGLSGNVFSVELTPNEYKAFSEESDDYRLAVVVSALSDPTLKICRYSKEQGTWIVEGGADRGLGIETRQSASITWK